MNIELTHKNASNVDKYTALTGFTREELTNWFLADYFKMFDDQSSVTETIGSMLFKDKVSAERVQAWLIERVSKKHDLNCIQTAINSNADGTFDVGLTVPCSWEEGGRYQVA
jgi:hypothetical protein